MSWATGYPHERLGYWVWWPVALERPMITDANWPVPIVPPPMPEEEKG